ncbi:MAG: hypothetical protein RL693_2724 [Verrucomicrobiota bacterium]|jgi:excisionase family DNA binding protein
MKTLASHSVPTKKDVLIARESSRLLRGLKLAKKSTVGMQIEGQKFSVPSSLAHLFMGALDNMAKGKSVAVVPLDEEMTTQEAAVVLNVSRPFVTKLFDEGVIPSRKVGTHRRANASAILAYKVKTDAKRYKAMDELVAQAQELNLGY